MELDFTGLEKLSHRSPQDGLLEGGQGRYTPKREKPAEGLIRATEGIGKLQREADRRKEETERNLEVYRTYQSNIKAAGQLRAEILKGAKNGESVYTLFLKAAKAISCMTGNTLFYKQLEGDIKTIYGEGLLEPAPLEMEIEAIKDRLQLLRSAKTRAGTTGESQSRIEAAIAAHEQRKDQLQALYMNRSERGKALTAKINMK